MLLAAGKVRCLGVMADERVAGFEEVPTFKEQGHDWSLAVGVVGPPWWVSPQKDCQFCRMR